ncbi:MAG: DUF4139 domain-containing protein [Alphaproteobacteria bacterium]|nr:DUF4139 domain-containing protein [Alphaproteobacteria bacterium]
MRLATFAALGALLVATAASAQQATPRLAITIYNNDIALVEDVRTVQVGSGRTRLEFPNVSGRIQPETASLKADGVSIVEQNFDFDLLTPVKMMEKAVGSRVRIVRTNPATGREVIETAEVLSANQGVVLRIGDRIEVLRDDGLPVRVLFDRIPENLRAKPTLSVTVDSERAGARPASLRYLTSGIGWSADYVGVFDERAGTLAMQGWVTLTNRTGASFANAHTQLVAGAPGETGRRSSGVRRAGTGGASSDQTSFADYHIYSLPEPTTIAENQTKQVSFLDAPNARASKVYDVERSGFGTERFAGGAAVRLNLRNAQDVGLGAALPEGTVRLYTKDSTGRVQFIGEDSIGHTSEGSDIQLDVGTAFDVTSQSTIVKRENPVEGVTVTEMAYVFRNARAEAVTINFEQGGLNGDHDLQRPSLEARKVDATTYAWAVPVPARGETRLTFTVREGKRRETPPPR